MKNTTIAIDLAKSVFEIGISDRPGHVARNHRLSRTEVSAFLAEQPPATVIMEACSSSHYWGRKFQSFGHDVKLLPPFYVRPYVQRSKTDRTDVKGMLEAWRNSDIRPVPIKTESQQQLTSLHRGALDMDGGAHHADELRAGSSSRVWHRLSGRCVDASQSCPILD